MGRARKITVIFLIIGFIGFGYSQYASASQIGVSITQSELVEENESKYNLQLEFDNPSLLYLTAGVTEFVITADGEKIGDGILQPFDLPPLTTTIANGTFETNKKLEDSNETPIVRINGVTQYDIVITSIDVPFVFYPTQEQAREFIH